MSKKNNRNPELREKAINKETEKIFLQLKKDGNLPVLLQIVGEILSKRNAEICSAEKLIEISFGENKDKIPELTKIRKKSLINNLMLKNTTLRKYKLDLLKQKNFTKGVEDYFTGINHPDVDDILVSAKKIKASFLGDCKNSQKKYSTALNSQVWEEKMDLLKESLKASRLGSIETDNSILAMAKLLNGEVIGQPLLEISFSNKN